MSFKLNKPRDDFDKIISEIVINLNEALDVSLRLNKKKITTEIILNAIMGFFGFNIIKIALLIDESSISQYKNDVKNHFEIYIKQIDENIEHYKEHICNDC